MTGDNLKQQVDLNTTAIEVFKQGFEYMKEGINDIKGSLKDIRSEMQSTYATKQELENVKDDLQQLIRLKEWALKILVGAIIVSLLTLLGLKS